MKKIELLKLINLEQFDEEQLEQIFLGLKDNLEITIYAKPEFGFAEMK